jgi:hypothetical protein
VPRELREYLPNGSRGASLPAGSTAAAATSTDKSSRGGALMRTGSLTTDEMAIILRVAPNGVSNVDGFCKAFNTSRCRRGARCEWKHERWALPSIVPEQGAASGDGASSSSSSSSRALEGGDDTQLRWVPLTTLAGTHQLTVGERVQGKFQGALGGVNWFDGCVTALHSECGACDIMYDDGDSEERVSARFIKVSVTGLEVKAVRQQQRQQSVGESAADEGSDAAGEGEATRAGAEGDAGTGDDADATEEADGSVEEPEEVEVLLDSAGRPIHLCGTFGCTLPDNHKGLHRVPDDGRGRLRRGKR